MAEETLTAEEQAQKDFVVGVIVAIAGNLCISISFQVTKYAHMNNHDGKPFTHIPIWWVGLVMMLGGEVGNFFAYGWAPATVVSPLGAVAVISNCVLARVFLKETITVRNLVGCLFAIVGAIGIAFTAPTSILITTAGNSTVVEEPGSRRAGGGGAVSGEYIYESLVSWRSLGFLIGVLVASAFLANPCEWKRAVSAELRGRYVVCNVLMCGLLGCISVMSAKGVATAFTQMLKGDFVLWVGPHCWLTWILIISAIGSIVGQVQFLNRAMMAFGASEVVPVYFVIFTLSTVTAGMVLYLELNFGTWWRGLLFVLGILCTFFGVSLINQRKNKDGAKEKEEEDEVDHNGVLEPLSGERGESRVGLVPRGRKSRMTPISEGLSGDGWGSGNVEGDNEDLEQPPNGLKEGDVDVSLTSDSESRAELPPSQTGARSPSVELATTPRSAHSSEHSISINSDMVAPRGTNTPRMHHSTQNTPRKDARMLDADAPAPPRLSADHAREPGLDANVPGPHRPSIDHGVAMIPLFDIARAVEYLRRQSTSPSLSSIITSPTLSVAISNDKLPSFADPSALEAGVGVPKVAVGLRAAVGSRDITPPPLGGEVAAEEVSSTTTTTGRFTTLLGLGRPRSPVVAVAAHSPKCDGDASHITPLHSPLAGAAEAEFSGATTPDPAGQAVEKVGTLTYEEKSGREEGADEKFGSFSEEKKAGGSSGGSSFLGSGKGKQSRRYERLVGSGTWDVQVADGQSDQQPPEQP